MELQERIQNKLSNELSPHYLQVLNESHKHNVAPGSESHFKVVIVSDQFDNLSTLKRHQKVYGVLSSEMTELHALSVQAQTLQQWEQSGEKVRKSPPCLGGPK